VGGGGTARLSVAAGHRMSITSAADSAGVTTAAAAAGEASTVSCGSGNSAPGAAGSSSPPQFKTVTELTLQQPGSSNPVTGWHNDFVKVGKELERDRLSHDSSGELAAGADNACRPVCATAGTQT
jgi:hypothetical protein